MLNTLREKIDGIDDQILQLIEQRATLAAEIKKFKPADKIICHQREDSIISRLKLINTTLIPNQGIEAIMREIIRQCRLVQINKRESRIVTHVK